MELFVKKLCFDSSETMNIMLVSAYSKREKKPVLGGFVS